jgi:O-antigen/teichoic acid export membrane protein
MGLVSKSASWNLLWITIGVILGAVNTILILPRVFEDAPEEWGLIKILISWALMFSQIFSFGASNVLIRFIPKFNRDHGSVSLWTLVLVIVGILTFLLLLFINGPNPLPFINSNDAQTLSRNMGRLTFLTISMIFFLFFQGYVISQFKTSFFQFLNEPWLKGTYLLIAVFYSLDFITFDLFINLIIGSYALAAMLLMGYSFLLRLSFKPSVESINGKEIVSYGAYSILDKGAQVIVNSLDIIMIGWLLSLDDVAFYSLPFFIAAVTITPQKAISTIANPLVSQALSLDENEQLFDLYSKSSLIQLIVGGGIFIAIWVSAEELLSLMPEKFGGGLYVILFIGISKLVSMATGVSGSIIVYSKYYKKNLYLNCFLIATTILTNYIFMSREFLNMGITGAALATSLTFIIYNALKVEFIQRKFHINPLSKKLGISILLIIILCTTIKPIRLVNIHQILAIGIKSAVALLIFSFSVYKLRLSIDLNAYFDNILRKK